MRNCLVVSRTYALHPKKPTSALVPSLTGFGHGPIKRWINRKQVTDQEVDVSNICLAADAAAPAAAVDAALFMSEHKQEKRRQADASTQHQQQLKRRAVLAWSLLEM